jgi:hypothetical protein
MKKLGLGYENYKEFIDEDMYYVDKTLFIRDLIERGGKVNLFTRPRRFGKTLTISMLKTFFEEELDRDGSPVDNHRYFEGMKINDCDERIMSKMGRYPVIRLSLKSAKQRNFYTAFMMLRDEIRDEYSRHDYVLNSPAMTEDDRNIFRSILSCSTEWEKKTKELKSKEEEKRALEIEAARFSRAIKLLSDFLKRYHGRGVVILIDEYDVPLENSFLCGFYDEMLMFLRSMFESALKTNDSLELAVITGCLRISKESIFTGLNNLVVNSILTPDFGEYFGFTDDEVREMLDAYGLADKYEEVQHWYDGYLFGDKNVYNPWSATQYVSDHIGSGRDYYPVSYWANTSSNSIVRKLVERADDAAKKEIEQLIEGGSIEKPVHEDITYEEIYRSQDNLWNFMFFTGYLKCVHKRYEEDKKTIFASLKIPNGETEYIYREKIINWFKEEVIDKSDRSALFKALKEGDAATLEQEINRLLQLSISYMDSLENFYHGFMVGILLGGEGYTVQSNRESGNGRSDILIKPVDPFDRAFVIELKTVKLHGKNRRICMELMDEAADDALNQIEDRNYMDALEEDGYPETGRYGISFFGKRCRVHYRKGYPK